MLIKVLIYSSAPQSCRELGTFLTRAGYTARVRPILGLADDPLGRFADALVIHVASEADREGLSSLARGDGLPVFVAAPPAALGSLQAGSIPVFGVPQDLPALAQDIYDAALARGYERIPDHSYVIGDDLVFHPKLYRLERKGQATKLTYTLMATLRCLVRHNDRPVSRDELEWMLDKPFTPQGTGRAVDVTVSRLRALLGSTPDKPIIRGVRGIGYQIDAPVRVLE